MGFGPAPWPAAAALVPGLVLVAGGSLAAWTVSIVGALPVTMVALVAGLALHRIAVRPALMPGVEFAVRPVLRMGVAMLGAGLTVRELASLGWAPILLGLSCVAASILIGFAMARLLGLRPPVGLLFGGAVGICGASAALAISAALPRSARSDGTTVIVVIGVTALSSVAMMLYPVLAAQALMTDRMAGIFFGSTIHDVAQVVGAGYALSDEAGGVATLVKLVRVAALVPVVGLVTWYARIAPEEKEASRNDAAGSSLVPSFLVWFVIMAGMSSWGLIPPTVASSIAEAGKMLLVAAIVGLGCKSSVSSLCRIGGKPVAMLVVPTLAIAGLAFAVLLTFPEAFR